MGKVHKASATVPYYITMKEYSFKNPLIGSADSLVGSTPTYRAVALQGTPVRVLARGPLPIPSPFFPTLCFLSILSYHRKGKNIILKKTLVYYLIFPNK